jgi:hypothetical protein
MSALQSGSPDGLLRLLSLGEKTPTSWQEEDASKILQHQLDAELQFDLAPPQPTLAAAKADLKELEKAKALGLKTFRDLFSSAEPPVEVLRLCKDFFKSMVQKTPKESADYGVANVLYQLSIAAARCRLDQRISSLTDAQLLQGIDWSLKRPWLDRNTQVLFKQLQKELKKGT